MGKNNTMKNCFDSKIDISHRENASYSIFIFLGLMIAGALLYQNGLIGWAISAWIAGGLEGLNYISVIVVKPSEWNEE